MQKLLGVFSRLRNAPQVQANYENVQENYRPGTGHNSVNYKDYRADGIYQPQPYHVFAKERDGDDSARQISDNIDCFYHKEIIA